MDKEMRKALRARAGYDWETHDATRRRNAEQLAARPTPEFPATGTARIGARIAAARAQRDAALRRMAGDGAGGLRTRRPLDNTIVAVNRVRVVRP